MTATDGELLRHTLALRPHAKHREQHQAARYGMEELVASRSAGLRQNSDPVGF